MNCRRLFYYFVVFLENRCRLHLFRSRIYLEASYFFSFGRRLCIEKPTAFTEKIQWIKLFDHNPMYTTITDKYLVKEYIRKCIGDEYNVPLLGAWTNTEDICLEMLPEKIVFKCSHDCGSFTVFKTNVDQKKSVFRYLNKQLKDNYYYVGREWAYKNIIPRIIAEPYLEDSDGKLWDYKFFCFGGKAKFFKIDFDRFVCHRANYYDIEGNYLDFGEEDYPRDPNRNITIPKELPQMVKIAERLSEGFRFLRVDMYNIDGVVKVGELSVYPGSGFLRYDPDEWDYKIGDMLALPVDNSNY